MKTETKEQKTTVVDSGVDEGHYDLNYKWAIIDHPMHGRLYLTQGFGGLDTMYGGLYRWRHGIAVQLLPDDTIESLSAPHNEIETIIGAACEGYRDDRPLLEWDGQCIANVAESCGL